jgi:uncharacterized membrane protein
VSGPAPVEIQRKLGEDMINVLVSNSPNPASGFLVLVPRSAVRPLAMPVEDALKFVMSGGVIRPAAPDPEDDASAAPVRSELPVNKGREINGERARIRS